MKDTRTPRGISPLMLRAWILLWYVLCSAQQSALALRNSVSAVCNHRSRSAFASTLRVVPLSFSEELGVSGGIFGNKFFDPLQLATEENFPRYREAELKHGRVAMFATIGMIFPVFFLDTKSTLVFLNKLAVVQPSLKTFPSGIRAITILPYVVWLSMILFIGVLELLVLKQRSKRALPGDYGTGFFGLHDYGKHETLLQQELESGRLAMLGFALQVIWEIVTNASVAEPYKELKNYILGALP